jgi:hypothetical protein
LLSLLLERSIKNMDQPNSSSVGGREKKQGLATFDDDDGRQLFLQWTAYNTLPMTDIECYYDLQYDEVAVRFSYPQEALEDLEACFAHWHALHVLSAYWFESQRASLVARFSGAIDAAGTLALRARFLGQGSRFHLYHHGRGHIIACHHTPLAVMEEHVVYDCDEAPEISCVKDDRMTVLVFERGAIISATTYVFDGSSLVEKGSIGKRLTMRAMIT